MPYETPPSWNFKKIGLGGGRLFLPLPAVRQEIRLLVLAEALTRRKLIADLRQWADGLETQQLSERSVVLVHGTNLRKHRNSALLERFQRSVFFDLPGEPQRLKPLSRIRVSRELISNNS